MKKYKVVGDHVVYGGPKNYKREKIHKSDAQLIDCLNFVIEKCNLKNADIEEIYCENVDQCKTMGTYNRYEILEDNSIDTLWKNLSNSEKQEIFSYAVDWMTNELAEFPSLLKKIGKFEIEP